MSGRNSFPEHHRLFAGFLAADRAKIVAALQSYDLIVVLGAPVFTYHVEGIGPFVPPDTQLIQLVDDAAMTTWAPVGLSIVTSLQQGIRDLLAGPAPIARSSPAIAARLPALGPTPLTDSYLLQQIARLRPKGSIIVEEAPSSRGPMHDYLPIIDPDTFYTCASGGLGHGLPAAVGVAMGRPGAKVIALVGDGSSMYSIQGLWSAAQRELPIAFIIIKNGGYDALHEFGVHFGMSELPGVRLPGLDFCGLARSQGMQALSVTKGDELDAALITAFESRTPMLVEVSVEGVWRKLP
jgi:benzoylformate decarboxylase